MSGDTPERFTPRASFIYGYYVAKIESLATTLQHIDMAHLSEIRSRILASAADLWDSLHAEDGVHVETDR